MLFARYSVLLYKAVNVLFARCSVLLYKAVNVLFARCSVLGASHLIPRVFRKKQNFEFYKKKKTLACKEKKKNPYSFKKIVLHVQIYTLFVDFVGAISHFIKKICCARCVSRLIIF